MKNLQPIWEQVEKLFEENVSLIPVYDSERTVNGRTRLAKQPCIQWKEFTQNRMTRQELYANLEKFDTTGVAVICGTISGNLEILDCDNKYYPGTDARFFADMRDLYPELLDKLRIHRTPSGGYHFLWRITDHAVPGNTKVASRPATDAELALKPKERTKTFWETRGEDGYAALPPSLNYSIHTDNHIPKITWEERCSIITLVASYTESMRIAEHKAPTKADEGYYDVSPWHDFDNRCNPDEIMEQAGWQVMSRNSRFYWYTRPGKTSGVSCSFNVQKRVFMVFTTNSDLDAHGYFPSIALKNLMFNGDGKATHAWLVQNGYGRISAKAEANIVRKAVRKPATDLPANLSESAITAYTAQHDAYTEQYPHGVFWKLNDKDNVVIDREKLYRVMRSLGLRLYDGNPVQIRDRIIHTITAKEFIGIIKTVIREQEQEEYDEIAHAFDDFMEKHSKYTISMLDELQDNEVLHDTAHVSYKPFLNGILVIKEDGYDLVDYEEIAGFIPYHFIQQREFSPFQGGLYLEFLQKAVSLNTNRDYIMKCIGYLAHDYRTTNSGYFILLCEQCEDPKNGGGSGKNIFSDLMRLTTTILERPGAGIKMDEKLYQMWNGERIMCFSDLERDFNYSLLKNQATGSGMMKKLYRDETTIAPEKMPKLMFSTQHSFVADDGGVRRRMRPIEFTDFFTKAGGVDTYFSGKMFPQDWGEDDYNGFYTFVAECIQLFISCEMKIPMVGLTETGQTKQFVQTYNQNLLDFLEEHWEWLSSAGFVTHTEMKDKLRNWYNANDVSHVWRVSSQKLNKAIGEYAKSKGYVHSHTRQISPSPFTKERVHDFLKEKDGAPF